MPLSCVLERREREGKKKERKLQLIRFCCKEKEVLFRPAHESRGCEKKIKKRKAKI